MNQNTVLHYLILNSSGALLSHAVLECPPRAQVWNIRLLDSPLPAFSAGERIHLVGMEDQAPSRSGEVLSQRGEILNLKPADTLGDDMRRNLRIPVRFESYLYPLTGDWIGRCAVISCDLSCGGVAFYCTQRLEPSELVEVVIPITSQPLVLRAQILRQLGSGPDGTLYASKFVDLTREEEALVRESVFGLQLQGRPC